MISEFQTKRYVCRKVSDFDLEPMYLNCSDPEISKHMSWSPHASKIETTQLISRLVEDWDAGRGYSWSIRLKSVEDYVGLFSIIAVKNNFRHRSLTYSKAELAYWCAQDSQRQGAMSEVGHAIVRIALNDIGLNKLVVSHHKDNTASEKLIKKLGFSLIGTERAAFMKDGAQIDVCHYEILKSDLIYQ